MLMRRYRKVLIACVWATSSLEGLTSQLLRVEVHFRLGLPVDQIMAGHGIIKNQLLTYIEGNVVAKIQICV